MASLAAGEGLSAGTLVTEGALAALYAGRDSATLEPLGRGSNEAELELGDELDGLSAPDEPAPATADSAKNDTLFEIQPHRQS